MSSIVVIGATGYAGGHIAAEAIRRDHQVVGVSRSIPADPRPRMNARTGTITDTALLDELAASASILVVAVPAAVAGAPFLPSVVPSLLDAVSRYGVRLGIVGGAGSLLVAPEGPRLIDTPGLPAAAKLEAGAQAAALDLLRASGSSADWFYLSPALGFGAHVPGQRTGSYRTGGDVLLTDAGGNSAIGGADYAIAFVDEIERPAHHRERFTVAY